MAIDFDRVGLLLHVAEKALGFPGLKPLHDEALKELKQHANSAAAPEPAQPRPTGRKIPNEQ